MALTNYMTGSEATAVTTAGGSVLQLGVDGAYSMLMWSIAFVQANFALMLVLGAIALIVGFGLKKLGAKRGASVVR